MDKALVIQKEVQRILGTDEVYLVGGGVRDLVMGNEPKDYDFCTPMLPEDIELMCQRRGRKVYGIGKQFGTIGFKVPY
jgi:poly(A) polymerase